MHSFHFHLRRSLVVGVLSVGLITLSIWLWLAIHPPRSVEADQLLTPPAAEIEVTQEPGEPAPVYYDE